MHDRVDERLAQRSLGDPALGSPLASDDHGLCWERLLDESPGVLERGDHRRDQQLTMARGRPVRVHDPDVEALDFGLVAAQQQRSSSVEAGVVAVIGRDAQASHELGIATGSTPLGVTVAGMCESERRRIGIGEALPRRLRGPVISPPPLLEAPRAVSVQLDAIGTESRAQLAAAADLAQCRRHIDEIQPCA
jgi:hypothetical protein